MQLTGVTNTDATDTGVTNTGQHPVEARWAEGGVACTMLGFKE